MQWLVMKGYLATVKAGEDLFVNICTYARRINKRLILSARSPSVALRLRCRIGFRIESCLVIVEVALVISILVS